LRQPGEPRALPVDPGMVAGVLLLLLAGFPGLLLLPDPGEVARVALMASGFLGVAWFVRRTSW
ncbi:hypothetical protein ACQ1ZW_15735, partial [Enterococcus faecalis]|uniref:hypothetical protein n=1 Tax=Enterococcus faecalis TaxID=1351 RepID=UPI003D6BF661